MSTPTHSPAAAAPKASSGPVAPPQRILTLDVLRGFGLGVTGTLVGTALRSIPPEQALGLPWLPPALSAAYAVGRSPSPPATWPR